MLDLWMKQNPSWDFQVITVLNTKVTALKYLNLISLIFCQQQIRFANNYSDFLSSEQETDILHTCGLGNRYDTFLVIETNILPACVVTKIRDAFPSEKYWGFKYVFS